MRPRTSATDLVQLLDRASDPVYVLDEERRIVFLNRAAEQWTGCDQAALLGQECRYHSSAEATGAAAVAAALCPPPEALAGRCASGVVSPPGAEGGSAPRQVDFVPLAGDDSQMVGVVAFVRPLAAGKSSDASDDGEPTPAALHERIRRYRRELAGRSSIDRLVGDSPAMRQVRNQVALAAQSTASVLLVGPPGSGRQHVARAIHHASDPRGAGPLVPLACPTLGAALLQSTLRGLARAAGAAGGESVRSASLLLIDVEQMPPEAQGELVARLPQFDAPLRVMATTHQPLAPLVVAGRFRGDLASGLATLTICLPPLAARLQDLPLLAQMFLEDSNARGAKQLAGFTPEALDTLAGYAWPGNVDELAEVVLQSHAQAEGPLVTPRDLPKRLHLAAAAARYPRKTQESIVLDEFLARVERELIERAMSQAKGNKTKAARLLGMTRPRLYRRLVQLGWEEEVGDG